MLQAYGDWMTKQRLEPGEPLWSAAQKLSAIAGQNFIVAQWDIGLGTTPCLFVAFAVGAAWVLTEALEGLRARRVAVWPLTTALWVLVYGLGIVCWIPLAWARYFLPLAPLVCVVAAHGAVSAARLFRRERGARLERDAWVAAAVVPTALAVWYGLRDPSVLPPDAAVVQFRRPLEMLQVYERAQTRDPESPLPAAYAGDLLLKAGSFGQARERYRRAAALLGKLPRGPWRGPCSRSSNTDWRRPACGSPWPARRGRPWRRLSGLWTPSPAASSRTIRRSARSSQTSSMSAKRCSGRSQPGRRDESGLHWVAVRHMNHFLGSTRASAPTARSSSLSAKAGRVHRAVPGPDN